MNGTDSFFPGLWPDGKRSLWGGFPSFAQQRKPNISSWRRLMGLGVLRNPGHRPENRVSCNEGAALRGSGASLAASLLGGGAWDVLGPRSVCLRGCRTGFVATCLAPLLAPTVNPCAPACSQACHDSDASKTRPRAVISASRRKRGQRKKVKE